MPRYPSISPSVAGMKSSIFSTLAHRLAQHTGPIFPLHVGDTWMEPAEGCRMEDLRVADHPGMHRYTNPHGLAPLLAALSKRVQERTGVTTTPDNLLMSAGATGGLSAAIGALIAPGEEVILLAPYWPLVAGMVRAFGGTPIPVPVFGAESVEHMLSSLASHLTERTAAVYFNTPNNPTGRVLPRSWVEAIVSWAKEKDLWILSDEVYEDYVYEGVHTYARALAPDRVLSAYSFSKAYGMAGNRCGYVVGPSEWLAPVRKVSAHTFYSAPTSSQLACLRALGAEGDAWVARARSLYREMGLAAAKRLGVKPPAGSTFLFLDIAEKLRPARADRVLRGLRGSWAVGLAGT